jgi:endo-1,4-beta-xylanase
MRSVAAGVSGLAAAGLGVAVPLAESRAEGPSLKQRAAAKGLMFGSEVLYDELTQHPEYAALVAEQCAIITPGTEAKWWDIEPHDGQFNFVELDWLVGFAENHGIAVRGHNLLWGVYNPVWAEMAVMLEGRGAEILRRHILTEVGRYKGRIQFWDVSNEPSDPLYNPLADGLVDNMWRRHIGPRVDDDAFRWAAEADGAALLFVNDGNFEYDEPDREVKRTIYLKLVEDWLRRGVPIKGFGLETHLSPTGRVAEKQYRRFLAELAGFGMTIHITELDVADRELPGDIVERDRLVAACCKQLLDIALDEGRRDLGPLRPLQLQAERAPGQAPGRPAAPQPAL